MKSPGKIKGDFKSNKVALENASLASVKFIKSKYQDVIKMASRKKSAFVCCCDYNLMNDELPDAPTNSSIAIQGV